ncbi:aromatic-ring hydroxylase C-terminal domain-containing protein [Nonomuraea turcica]|uniref:aromatic-ring hydroxylase C-terminal domain-containing protein n=1 Tax=Nonomuraea sp. G32 TaxID=3067274 RepID=UPI00352FFF4A
MLLTAGEAGPDAWADRGRHVRALRRQRPEAALIRPDGYVAWAGSRAGIRSALSAWCGTPPPDM